MSFERLYVRRVDSNWQKIVHKVRQFGTPGDVPCHIHGTETSDSGTSGSKGAVQRPISAGRMESYLLLLSTATT